MVYTIGVNSDKQEAQGGKEGCEDWHQKLNKASSMLAPVEADALEPLITLWLCGVHATPRTMILDLGKQLVQVSFVLAFGRASYLTYFSITDPVAHACYVPTTYLLAVGR